MDGLGGLRGIRHVAEVGQQPACKRRADAHAGFLRRGGGRENNACGAHSEFPFREIRGVGDERPVERGVDAGEDHPQNLEGENECGLVRADPVERDGRERHEYHTGDEGRLFAHRLDGEFCEHRAEDHGEAADEEISGDPAVVPFEITLEIIDAGGAADDGEGDIDDAGDEHHQPVAVGEQGLDVAAELGFLLRRRLDALAGGVEGDEEKHHRHHGEEHDGALGAELLVCATELFDEKEETRVRDDAADLCEHHPVAVHAGAFQRIIGHHAGQRAVGNIDRRVEQHQQVIGGPCPNQLAPRAEVGRGEGQHEDHGQRHAQPNQIGTEAPPLCFRPVGHGTDEEVPESIGKAGEQEHRARGHGGDAEDVSVEEHDEIHHERPHEVAGSVAEAVADFFLD